MPINLNSTQLFRKRAIEMLAVNLNQFYHVMADFIALKCYFYNHALSGSVVKVLYLSTNCYNNHATTVPWGG